VPGVDSVTVNFAAGSATVRYDETRLAVADIKTGVRQHGYASAAPAAVSAGDGHQAHTLPAVPPVATPGSIPPSTAPVAVANPDPVFAATSRLDKAAPSKTSGASATPAAGEQRDKTALDIR
jgi:hypothetical protein